MKADRAAVLELLAAYLEEYGSEPGSYDRHSFVDWCACAILDTDAPSIYKPGTSGLIQFYQDRIASCRAIWAADPAVSQRLPVGCCRQVVTDNFGELVEIWDCLKGEERIELGPEGRVRVFEVASVFRSERFIWTEAGRAAIIAMREEHPTTQ